MAHLKQEDLAEPGRVNRVRQEWLIHEDGVLAHNLQEREFGDKYQFNKVERKTARTDVPLAKYVQTEEEVRLQKEQLEKLAHQQAIAQRDAEIAEKVQKLEEEKHKSPPKNSKSVKDDEIVAQQFQQEEMIELERERIRREIHDQEYARLLQEKERRALERRHRQRELAHERKVLQQEQQMHAERVLAGHNPGIHPPEGMADLSIQEPARVVRTDGRVEDVGDFSDFYIKPNQQMPVHEIKELQELQDEELARLLQDQEQKRGAQINKTALKELEDRDAEIARLMHEQEKLKAKRKHRGAPRHPPEGGGGQGGQRRPSGGSGGRESPHAPPQYSRYRAENPGERNPPVPAKLPQGYQYEEQNSYNEYMNGSNGSGGPPRSHDPSHDPSQELAVSYYQGQSPYQQRPLPRTPMDAMPGNITVVPVDTAGISPPESPPPPGYIPPPAYPSKRQDPYYPHSMEPSPPSGNVIAAIDPTYRDRGHPPNVHHHNLSHGDSPPDRRQQQQHPEAHRGEDSYCDLDDLGPVQGQRRPTLPRNEKMDSKKHEKGNCKQQ